MPERILVVEDDETLLRAFTITLTRAGFEVATARDGTEALKELDAYRPDVIVCDYMLPVRDGLGILAEARARAADSEFIVLTAFASLDIAIEALRLGASDFLTKPVPLELLTDRVQRAAERIRLRREVEMARQAREQARERLVAALSQAKQHYLGMARILGGVIDLYDPAQGGHAKRVAELAGAMAREAGLGEDEQANLEVAAVLHDIGYLALPPARARRPNADLSSGEQLVVREHPILGETLLGSVGADAADAAASLVRHHHEQWDGGGFPDGLAGDAIPFSARILAVCEAYDESLTWPLPGAAANAAVSAELLRRGRGRAFDPEAVDLLLRVTGRAVQDRQDVTAIPISRLEERMVLARAIYTVNGLLLLPEGQVLTRTHIDRIRNFHNVHPIGDRIYVYRPPLGEEP
jgi:response regulator RpfG family c-di-GMP phosphodiesterase